MLLGTVYKVQYLKHGITKRLTHLSVLQAYEKGGLPKRGWRFAVDKGVFCIKGV